MKRSPTAAAWLSLLPGLGHLYLGQVAKGFALALLTVGLIDLVSRAEGALGLLIPVYWLFVMLDAHRSAQLVNRALEKEGEGASRADHSPWWGATLIGLGVLFLLYNFDIIDFDRLWRFWPVALIGLGLKLLKQGWGGRPATAGETPAPREEGADDLTAR